MNVGVRGADGHAPSVVGFDGEMTASDIYGGTKAGLHPEALNIYIGSANVTLLPDYFVRAEWAEDGGLDCADDECGQARALDELRPRQADGVLVEHSRSRRPTTTA